MSEDKSDATHTDLGSLRVSRLVCGLWQVADLEREGGLGLDREAALAALAQHRAAGLTTLDMADHYGSAEELVGEFGERDAAAGAAGTADGAAPLAALTNWCPSPGGGELMTGRQNVDISVGGESPK